MSALIQHMEREFRLAGFLSGTDTHEEFLVDAIRELVKVYAAQGHSGGSGFQTLTLFDRLVNGNPLTPLLGGRSEWTDVSPDGEPGKFFQNVRYSKVFWNRAEGYFYDDGMKPVYVYPDGTAVTKSDDQAPQITFPYMPGFPPVINVDAQGNPTPVMT